MQASDFPYQGPCKAMTPTQHRQWIQRKTREARTRRKNIVTFYLKELDMSTTEEEALAKTAEKFSCKRSTVRKYVGLVAGMNSKGALDFNTGLLVRQITKLCYDLDKAREQYEEELETIEALETDGHEFYDVSQKEVETDGKTMTETKRITTTEAKNKAMERILASHARFADLVRGLTTHRLEVSDPNRWADMNDLDRQIEDAEKRLGIRENKDTPKIEATK